MDLCEFEGPTILYYSWGDHVSNEFLAHAAYDGPLDDLLRGSFPIPY